jgi:hypothetical protein
MLKNNNWTNEEVIDILEGCKIHIGDKKRSEEHLKTIVSWNQGIEQAIIQFGDFMKSLDEYHDSMAYDTETKQIYVTGPPLPQ